MRGGEERTVVHNRRATHEYALEERYEAGLVLEGSEVKALREGRAQIREAYGVVRGGEAFLLNMHIAPYSRASTHQKTDPLRPRKLLLHRWEIDELARASREKGKTIVPLRVYFRGGLAKVELAVARGKPARDRRREIAEREARREMERAARRRQRGA